uniref:AcidPPc domain-containing protein n=1 Tax=Steinernema glaseri TaxID=37863 RepID=A0A1I8AE17_9BILA
MLIVVGILIPSALILATEVFRTLAWEKKCAHLFNKYHMRNTQVHRLIVRLYIFIGYFFLGVCFNQLMVDIAKYTIGRQRPHFMEVCKPNVGYRNCGTNHTYITDFWCTTTDTKVIHEAQLSFYSGHSSFSFYAAWYTSLYLQARLYRPLYSRLLLPVIQFSLFGGAAFVAYSRVSDYKHHWSDVLVGSAMGSAIGIIMALFIAEVFNRREIPACSEGAPEGHNVNLMPLHRRPDPELGTQPLSANTVVETKTVLMSSDMRGPSIYNSGGNPVEGQRIDGRTPIAQTSQIRITSNGYKSELHLDPVLVVAVNDDS